MKFESKFSLNQKVYRISYHTEENTVKCEACNGMGDIILLNNEKSTCPKCYGRGTITTYRKQKWFLTPDYMKIGQCRAEITIFSKVGVFDNIGEYNPEKIEKVYQYMCYETGIGSRTLHYEDTLYPTREEAQAECDKRNLAGIGY